MFNNSQHLTTQEVAVDEEQSRKIAQLKQWLQEQQQALTDAGVAVIVGVYDGSGDEGTFQGIDALDGDGLPAKYTVPAEIEELIEALVDELATPGYENNDGGGGEIRLIVDRSAITHESYFYTVERNSDEVQEY